ncbi:MAG: GntR family transcriptional regulator [Rhodocyclaceae bacterium]
MNMPATNGPTGRRSDQLREEIEERIATGVFPPGTRLDENELASEFGVSRTPIREALIQLNSEGVIDMRPRRGAVVVEVSPQRLCEMFEVMAELEAMCARLAARRITAEEEKMLRSAHETSRAARDRGDPNAYFYLNETFHQVIYATSHNAFLNEQALVLQRRLRPYRRMQLHVRDRVRTSFDEHNAIVEAICAGDGERAATLVREHVTVQGERFGDLIASLGALKERRRA